MYGGRPPLRRAMPGARAVAPVTTIVPSMSAWNLPLADDAAEAGADSLAMHCKAEYLVWFYTPRCSGHPISALLLFSNDSRLPAPPRRSCVIRRRNNGTTKNRWESVITHVPGGGAPGYPAGELIIKCNLNYIDGPDGVLGSAGPEGIWDEYPGISYMGTMVREVEGGSLGKPSKHASFVGHVRS